MRSAADAQGAWPQWPVRPISGQTSTSLDCLLCNAQPKLTSSAICIADRPTLTKPIHQRPSPGSSEESEPQVSIGLLECRATPCFSILLPRRVVPAQIALCSALEAAAKWRAHTVSRFSPDQRNITFHRSISFLPRSGLDFVPFE